MSKSDRLFRLLHLMRTLPQPVAAHVLAEKLEVSERTLYRDIDTLRAGGALIDGASGLGYTLTEDPALPPQMFSQLEVEALVLGLAHVRFAGDAALVEAAEGAMAKVVATLPERVQRQAAHAVLQVYKFNRPPEPPPVMGVIRQACWDEQALDMIYSDAGGTLTERRIWPLSIVFVEQSHMLLAWCCLRQDFRKFVLTRIRAVTRSDESFRPRRVSVLRDMIAEMTGSQRV
ncbi:MAG: YafY family protein [Deltaproteobacteria bacterium]